MRSPSVYARAHGHLPHIAEPFSQRARERRLDQLLILAHVTPRTRILDVSQRLIQARGFGSRRFVSSRSVW